MRTVHRHGLPERQPDREAARLRGGRLRRRGALRAGPGRHRPQPEEIRALASRLGLTLDLYQPLRDIEGVNESSLADNLRRAEAKFALMQRLGIETDLGLQQRGHRDRRLRRDLRRPTAEPSATWPRDYGIRVAFEALAWGRFVDDYRRAWRIVERADHPRSVSAWTVSTSCPAATIQPASRTSPARRSSSSSWPTRPR